MDTKNLIVGNTYRATDEAMVSGHDGDATVTFPKETVFTYKGLNFADEHIFESNGIRVSIWNRSQHHFVEFLEPM